MPHLMSSGELAARVRHRTVTAAGDYGGLLIKSEAKHHNNNNFIELRKTAAGKPLILLLR